MKKLILLLLIVGMGYGLSAQTNVFFYEDFADGIPADFHVSDLGGKAPVPTFFQGKLSWVWDPGLEAAASTSWFNPPGAANAWMITPGIEIPALSDPDNKMLLTWFGLTFDPQYPDGYRVLISTVGNTPEDFDNGDVVFSIPAESTTGVTRSIDITDYEGETIYIAFHNNSNDQFVLVIDDILVGEFAEFDISTVANRSKAYNPQGNLTVRTEVANRGHAAINTVVAHYRVDDGDVITDTISGLNIQPFRNQILNHPTPANMTVGTSKIESWVSAVNMVELPGGSTEIVEDFFSTFNPDDAVSRKVLVETFSASTCAPCAPANTALHNLINSLPVASRPIGLKWQQNFPGAGDPYATDELIIRRLEYNISGIPASRIDGDFWAGNTTGVNAARINGAAARPGLMSYDVKYTIDEENQTIAVKGNIISHANILPGTRLKVAIREATTVNNVGTNGETLFRDVVKKLMHGNDGIDLGGMEAGTVMDIDFEYQFNGEYRLPLNGQPANRINHDIEHSVENFMNLEVVVWADFPRDDNYVLNVAEAELETTRTSSPVALDVFNVFPNPASQDVQVDITLSDMLECQITLFDVTGKPARQVFYGSLPEGATRLPVSLDGLASGTYFLHLRSAQGVTVRSLEVIR
jgi:hypothetical protein